MIYYISVYTFFWLFSFVALDKAIDRSRFVYYFVFVFLVSFVGLRYGTVDYGNYVSWYNRVVSQPDLTTAMSESRDFGFAWLSWYVSRVGLNVEHLFFLVSFLAVGAKVYVYKKTSPLFVFAIFCYIALAGIHKDLGQIRNGFAAGFVLLGLYFLFSKRYVFWIALNYLAYSMHAIAAMSYFYAVARLLSSKVFLAGVVLTSFVVMAGLSGLGSIFAGYLEYSGFESRHVDRALRYYGREGSRSSVVSGMSLFVFFSAIVFVLLKDYICRVSRFNEIAVPVYVLTVALYLALRDFSILSSRIYELTALPLSPVLWASVVYVFNGLRRVMVFFAVSFFVSLWFVAFIINQQPNYHLLFFS